MPEINIIDQSDDYLVVNKPAGLIAHGAAHLSEPSLIELLLRDFPEIARVGDDPYRPGLMHRLDKFVSGLMVIARNQETFEALKEQFKNRLVDKAYVALAHGEIARDEGTIDFPIARSAKGYRMAALPKNEDGVLPDGARRAATEFLVLGRYINFTLAKAVIRTGRTHQIRVHFAAYGYPLVGDELYSTAKTKRANERIGLGRIFLAATDLAFSDRDGTRREYHANLPDDLERFLATLVSR